MMVVSQEASGVHNSCWIHPSHIFPTPLNLSLPNVAPLCSILPSLPQPSHLFCWLICSGGWCEICRLMQENSGLPDSVHNTVLLSVLLEHLLWLGQPSAPAKEELQQQLAQVGLGHHGNNHTFFSCWSLPPPFLASFVVFLVSTYRCKDTQTQTGICPLFICKAPCQWSCHHDLS